MPKCPECGAEMVKRVARRGKYRGQEFYGCSNYPRCKAIINIDKDDKEVDNTQKISNKNTLAKEVSARILKQDRQRKYFDSLAVTENILEKISYDKKITGELKKYSKWYLEYSSNLKPSKNDLKPILNILMKIFTRGDITVLSKYAEDAIKEIINDSKDSTLENYVDYTKDSYYQFDSEEEEIFYNEVMPEILGSQYKEYIFPQMSIGSLLNNVDTSAFDYQYVDFFISDGINSFIIEIDGLQHNVTKEVDKKRDKVLEENGFSVLRIPAKNIRNKEIKLIKEHMSKLELTLSMTLSEMEMQSINLLRLINQINIAIIHSLQKGLIDLDSTINLDLSKINILQHQKNRVIKIIEKDVNTILNKLIHIYYKENYLSDLKFRNHITNTDVDLIITYDENLLTQGKGMLIKNFRYPYDIVHYNIFSKPITPKNINKEDLEYFLQYIFRKESFWEGQYEIIKRTLNKNDSIVLLPTGAGKSISYQLSSLLSTGVSIIIAPIIALIDDQVDNLRNIGITKAVGISSQITDSDLRNRYIDLFAKGHYSMCLISPERFQIKEFRDSVRELLVSNLIASIVIDEAHCVSEWGHDFRTSYLNIGRITRQICSKGNYVPPLLALTGTASNSVLKDVKRILEIDAFDAIISPDNFDREELNFDILRTESKNKDIVLKGLLSKKLPNDFNIEKNTFFTTRKKHTNSGLIFCPHVNGNYGVTQVSKFINKEINIVSHYYSGSKPKHQKNTFSWNVYKKEISREFKNNEFPLLVATKSYGMGIDKSNIRYTIHYGLPQSIESFYQEAGRAGRDKKRSQSYIIMSVDDEERAQKLLNINTKIETIKNIMENEVTWDNADDITRQMYFHTNAFSGVQFEMSIRDQVFKHLGDFENNTTKKIVANNRNQLSSFEKIIHRLVILGVVKDYTVNFANYQLTIYLGNISKDNVLENYSKYIEGYSKKRVPVEVGKIDEIYQLDKIQFIKKSVEILTRFVYETIEKSRRRGFYEIFSMSKDALNAMDSDKIIRKRMLAYLQLSNSEEMEKVLESEDLGFSIIQKIIDGYELESGKIVGGIVSPKEANQLRGNVIRSLESYPDHPGLLFLRGLIEVFCDNSNYNDIVNNIRGGLKFNKELYSIEEKHTEVYSFLVWLLNSIYEYDKALYKQVFFDVIDQVDESLLLKYFLEFDNLDQNMLLEPVMIYFDLAIKNVNLKLDELY